jgi:pimeloyl-ACP methyl ester carboxylesterase
LLEAAAEIKDIESLLGHSMGGSAALYAVSQGLSAKRAVTIGSPAALTRALQRFADRIALPDSARSAFVDVVDRHVGVGAAELDAVKLAHELRLETLIVHDRDDREVPYTEAQAWAAAWPAARLLTTSGLGHTRVLADPTVVQVAVRFLLGLGRGPLSRAI